MNIFDKIRVIKAGHFISFMDIYLKIYGGFRFGTVMQKAVTALSTTVSGAIPYVLKIDLLQNCNLRCGICYAEQGKAEMHLDDFKRIISPLKGLGCRVDLMGGEPFLYSRLDEAVSFASNKMKFREIIVYTNGTCITAEKAVSVKKAGLTHAMASISSHDEKKHDLFTGVRGSWQSSIAGMRHLKDAGIDTSAFVVLHRNNIMDYESIAKFFREDIGVTPVFFQYVPKNPEDPLIPSKYDWDKVKRKIFHEDETGRVHGRTISSLISLCGKNCLGGYYSYSIKVNGDVTPCPFIHDIIIGNVLDNGIWDVFLRRKKNEIYRKFISVPEECRSCTYCIACSGGCRAGQNDYGKKDPRCLGPWDDSIDHDKVFDKIPTFF